MRPAYVVVRRNGFPPTKQAAFSSRTPPHDTGIGRAPLSKTGGAIVSNRTLGHHRWRRDHMPWRLPIGHAVRRIRCSQSIVVYTKAARAARLGVSLASNVTIICHGSKRTSKQAYSSGACGADQMRQVACSGRIPYTATDQSSYGRVVVVLGSQSMGHRERA